VFIENGHVHIDRIVGAVTGRASELETVTYEQPES
jgi:hypothetical protein